MFVDDGVSGAVFKERPGLSALRAAISQRPLPFAALILTELDRLGREQWGTNAVLKELLQAGVHVVEVKTAPAPTPRRANRPRGWSPTTVRDVLQRPDYMGELRWGRVRKRDAWGARRPQRQPPQDDWTVVQAPHLAIVSRELWDAAHAHLREQRAIYLRDTGGQLQSKPANGMASKYLLTGLATCGVCRGSFGPRLAAGRSRRQVYRCLVNHTRGPAVCTNALQVPVLAADTAVLTLVEATVLRPDVVVAAVDEALRRLRPESASAERTRLETARRQIEGQLANLTAAITAGGGDTATLVQAVKDRERERARLTRALVDLETLERLSTLDTASLERRLTAKLADWRGLLGRHPQQARQILTKVLAGRLTFTPRLDPASGANAYAFTGAGRLEGILSGVIDLPTTLVTPAGFEPAFTVRHALS